MNIFPMRGFWVVLFYIAFDVVYTYFGIQDNVAHSAHLGGFIGGVALAAALLFARVVNARGNDLFSVALGTWAWNLIGKPNAKRLSIW
ncbi:MAG: rhomboid family intramembrane serine protease [Phycisphaerales bacterium]|nr:rhomboid family intramembrane serine protease [Phycisphaerales bacterium]